MFEVAFQDDRGNGSTNRMNPDHFALLQVGHHLTFSNDPAVRRTGLLGEYEITKIVLDLNLYVGPGQVTPKRATVHLWGRGQR